MKKLIAVTVAVLLLLTGCGGGVSQEEYDALVAENESLRQQIAQLQAAYGGSQQDIPDAPEYVGDPAEASDFIYVNNGSQVQINGYQGKGGHVVIPDKIEGSPVTRIAPEAFMNVASVTGITLPDTLEFIGMMAFCNLPDLTGVLVIPESVTEIESHCFMDSGLTGLVIKGNCKIGVNAFIGIPTLEFIYVEEGCSPQIAVSVFSYLDALTMAVLPDSVVSIKDDTFKGSNNLVIYTPEGSGAQEYANRNFIRVDTGNYKEMADKFADIY